MNFAVDVVEAADAEALALVELDRAGGRREHRFGAVAQAVRTMAAELHGHGVRRGDVVLTLVGNQPDWVVAMVACFRQGYVVLPCTEQLRAKDLMLRLPGARARRGAAAARGGAPGGRRGGGGGGGGGGGQRLGARGAPPGPPPAGAAVPAPAA